MKNLKNMSRSMLAVFVLLLGSSCEDDNEKFIATNTTPIVLSDLSFPSIELDPVNINNPAVTFNWNAADYGQQVLVKYQVEVSADEDFSNTTTLATVDSRNTVTLSMSQLNIAATTLELPAFVWSTIYARVTSSLGTEQSLAVASNSISFDVYPFEQNVEPKLFLVGAPQAYYGLGSWDNATALPLRYIGDGITKLFEAYVKVAAADGFKFIGEQGTWDKGNYGTNGGVQDGTLLNDGGSSDIKIAEVDGDGLYYIQVDMDALTYKSIKMDWGIIGNATPDGWSSETPMTYDFETNEFSISTNLENGEMKFRSSNTGLFIYDDAWKFNVGVSDPTVTYNPDAGNISISAGLISAGLKINFDGTAVVSGL